MNYKNVKIIAVARHPETVPSADNIYPFAADLSEKEGIDSLFNFAEKSVGTIHLFIANAGFAYLERLYIPDMFHIEKIYALNVFSQIYALEKLTNRQQPEKIMFVSVISGAGVVSLPGYSLYCSTKAALHHFFQTYRYEQHQNLHIMKVYPVATKTDFFDKAAGKKNTPMPWPAQNVQTVAKKIIVGIQKEKKKVYPSLLFRLFYPLGRTFPILLHLYSLLEKRKIKDVL